MRLVGFLMSDFHHQWIYSVLIKLWKNGPRVDSVGRRSSGARAIDPIKVTSMPIYLKLCLARFFYFSHLQRHWPCKLGLYDLILGPGMASFFAETKGPLGCFLPNQSMRPVPFWSCVNLEFRSPFVLRSRCKQR